MSKTSVMERNIACLERKIAREDERLGRVSDDFFRDGGVCCPSCGVPGYREDLQKQERRDAWLLTLRMKLAVSRGLMKRPPKLRRCVQPIKVTVEPPIRYAKIERGEVTVDLPVMVELSVGAVERVKAVLAQFIGRPITPVIIAEMEYVVQQEVRRDDS